MSHIHAFTHAYLGMPKLGSTSGKSYEYIAYSGFILLLLQVQLEK